MQHITLIPFTSIGKILDRNSPAGLNTFNVILVLDMPQFSIDNTVLIKDHVYSYGLHVFSPQSYYLFLDLLLAKLLLVFEKKTFTLQDLFNKTATNFPVY